MKKFISLLLALVMALSLVACGAKNDTKTDDTANPDGEATPTNALEQIKAPWPAAPTSPPWSSWTPPRPVRISM